MLIDATQLLINVLIAPVPPILYQFLLVMQHLQKQRPTNFLQNITFTFRLLIIQLSPAARNASVSLLHPGTLSNNKLTSSAQSIRSSPNWILIVLAIGNLSVDVLVSAFQANRI